MLFLNHCQGPNYGPEDILTVSRLHTVNIHGILFITWEVLIINMLNAKFLSMPRSKVELRFTVDESFRLDSRIISSPNIAIMQAKIIIPYSPLCKQSIHPSKVEF